MRRSVSLRRETAPNKHESRQSLVQHRKLSTLEIEANKTPRSPQYESKPLSVETAVSGGGRDRAFVSGELSTHPELTACLYHIIEVSSYQVERDGSTLFQLAAEYGPLSSFTRYKHVS